MPNYQPASKFSIVSVDHQRVLLDENVHSTKELLGDAETPLELKVAFDLEGVTHERTLKRTKGAFSEGATITFGSKDGDKVVPVGKTYAYKSDDKNWVLKFQGQNKFQGMVFGDDGKTMMHLVGENGSLKVDSNAHRHFKPMDTGKRNLKSQVEASAAYGEVDYWADCHDNQPAVSEIYIGAAIGYTMYSNDRNGVLDEVESYITLSNTIYERQMDVIIVIDDVVVDTDGATYPWSTRSCRRTDIQRDHLYGLRDWNKPKTLALWHLFEDCFGASGSTLGVAYIGSLCENQVYNVGVSYKSTRDIDDDYPTWGTVAHELGHNFNGQHSFEEGQGRTGGIMDYGPIDDKAINGVQQFNTQYRKREVCNQVSYAENRNRNWCMRQTNGRQPTPEPLIYESTTPCNSVLDEGCSFLPVSEELKCVKHRNRAIVWSADKPLRVERLGVSKEQCQAACNAEVDCKAFTVGRNGYCELLGEVEGNDLGFQFQYDTYVCGEGVEPSGALAERTIDDVLETVNLSELSAECCTVGEQEYFSLNTALRTEITQEECFNQCLLSSQCEAASFDKEADTCLYYGGHEFRDVAVESTRFESLTCNRQCISASVASESSDSGSSSAGVAVGVSFLLVGAVLAGIATVLKVRRKTSKTVEVSGEVPKTTV